MWFRNLILYRLDSGFDIDPEQLAEQLSTHAFHPCGPLAASSHGWVPPLGRLGSELTHSAAGRTLICARHEERLLPAAVVREALEQRVEEIENQQARSVGRKERQQLKDEITFELLPKAFTRSRRNYAYIDTKQGWLVVDASSPKRAEELLSLLRESLGKLPARLPQTHLSPTVVMTEWLTGDRQSGLFEPLDECELRDPQEEGGVVRCRNQPLFGDEIATHLEAGKRVTRLAVRWDERLNFLLTDDLTIKRLRFEDMVNDELEQLDDSDELAMFDARFALMGLELARLLPALLEAFGGESEE